MNIPSTAQSQMQVQAGMSLHMAATVQVFVEHRYNVLCLKPDGNIRWQETFDNLVTNAGLDKYLDATLKTGLAVPAWYVGLKATGSVAATDTMSTHPSWLELTDYTEGTRQTWTPGAISTGSVSNTASRAQFSINASVTIYGAFVVDSNVKGNPAGTLLGAGDFSIERAALSGDTLSVAVTMTMQASGSV